MNFISELKDIQMQQAQTQSAFSNEVNTILNSGYNRTGINGVFGMGNSISQGVNQSVIRGVNQGINQQTLSYQHCQDLARQCALQLVTDSSTMICDKKYVNTDNMLYDTYSILLNMFHNRVYDPRNEAVRICSILCPVLPGYYSNDMQYAIVYDTLVGYIKRVV